MAAAVLGGDSAHDHEATVVAVLRRSDEPEELSHIGIGQTVEPAHPDNAVRSVRADENDFVDTGRRAVLLRDIAPEGRRAVDFSGRPPAFADPPQSPVRLSLDPPRIVI